MDKKWQKIAQRIVQGLRIQPGELIDVRDHTGSLWIFLWKHSLRLNGQGQRHYFNCIRAIIWSAFGAEAALDHLTHWDKYRQEWMKHIDRVLVLSGTPLDFSLAPKEALDAWEQAQYRLSLIEESRRLLIWSLPFLQRSGQNC